MKKQNWMVAVVMAVALSGGAALAATLSNGAGQSCGDSVGTWHFVNNQTGGELTPGNLVATFTSGVQFASAYQVNANMQHFEVIASGTLLDASTDLDGRLVLSHFTCDDVKEPPPCDPKTEVCK
jgi:hypothetical protein